MVAIFLLQEARELESVHDRVLLLGEETKRTKHKPKELNNQYHTQLAEKKHEAEEKAQVCVLL